MITDFYPPFIGGVEVLVASVSRELVRRGHHVAVATLAAPGLPSAEDDAGVRVHRIRTSAQRIRPLFTNKTRPWAPPAPDPGAVAGIRRIVAGERPDIVHGHDWLARSYLPLKRRGARPLVMSLHYYTLSCPKKNLMFEGAPCSGPALTKCLGCAGRHYGAVKGAAVTLGQWAFSRGEASLVDLFLPVSAATAVGNGLPEAGLPFKVVPNFVRAAPDPGPYAEQLRALPEEPFLLFVGDVRRDKGADVLLDAYAQLRDAPPLLLLGKVWAESPSTLPPGVVLLRDWPNGAVREAMRSCLALVVPSVWPEPFGIVVLEALAAGRPIVGSSIGGIPEIVRDEREGLLVVPGDTCALSAALDRLIHDDGLRDGMAAAAGMRAKDFTANAVLPRFEAAYADVQRTASV